MDKLKMQTPDLTERNFAALVELFPNAVTETVDENGVVVRAIDKDVLAQEINVPVVEGREERYQFTWPDKRKSILLANASIVATLRPCREESVNFDTTENLYIEGDNLDVLKLLCETYFNHVKMIYIDPPYNTGNDFIYADDFAEDVAEFLVRDGQYGEDGNRMVKNLDSNGRFHTDWLNMVYPRLRVAQDLLTAGGGVIFISVDENEIENLKKICNEIFGESNFRSCISWQKRYTRSNNTVEFTTMVEYILVYSKSPAFNVNLLMRSEEADSRYTNPDNDLRGAWKGASFLNPASPSQRPNLCYPITNPNTGTVTNPTTHAWRRSKEVFEQLAADNRLYWGLDGTSNVPSVKMFLSEARGLTPINFWSHEYAGNTDNGTAELGGLLGGKYFEFPKPSLLIKRVLEHGTDEDSIVLDFFSGSATTAHAVMQLNAEDGGNRKFIMVQLPEVTDENSEAFKAGYANICEIGKERIRRAGQKIQAEWERKHQQTQISYEANDKGGGASTQSSLGSPPDIGFRVLKLDSSNMKEVYYTLQEYAQMQFNFDGLVDNIKSDRTAEDLLFQVMLDLGVPLSSKIEVRQIGGKEVHFVNDGYLVACFESVTDEVVTAIAQGKPYYAVFRDSSFATDSTLVNFEQIFRTYSPTTQRRVL